MGCGEYEQKPREVINAFQNLLYCYFQQVIAFTIAKYKRLKKKIKEKKHEECDYSTFIFLKRSRQKNINKASKYDK